LALRKKRSRAALNKQVYLTTARTLACLSDQMLHPQAQLRLQPLRLPPDALLNGRALRHRLLDALLQLCSGHGWSVGWADEIEV
jgi:hypothetical protein